MTGEGQSIDISVEMKALDAAVRKQFGITTTVKRIGGDQWLCSVSAPGHGYAMKQAIGDTPQAAIMAVVRILQSM